ncbi:alpha/beta hydrolase-fold protein [Paenibacillus sp. J5C_2022]|uniref:alpha/beta hydrolase n=1 Tax=Paenibacillus sp. J5C2022 TaxID=2977129 RepID=UPI0021D2A71F|nr:alpha/beta hydrolase-fold protein [Paenibacillus sp. J5C2022]MCU6712895.1 alpha/beta hydrolase-fold protein [Paenibacillus sp. J5C2022]
MTNRSTILRIENFYSAHLNNARDIFIYLPPGYRQERAKRFPVLYMHDGQNIFHPAFNGYSWQVHDTVDRLIALGRIEEIIVVGLANRGMERADEFTHELEGVRYEDDKVSIRPKGHLYEAFVIEEVKPFIDEMFRTLPDRENTALMGSSRGGQVTYHIGFRRPDIFGKLAIVSPYFYCVDPVAGAEAPQLHTFRQKQPLSRIWIDLGGREGTLVMEKHVRGVAEQLLSLGYSAGEELAYYCDPDAEHVEKDWAARLASPLTHLFGSRGEIQSLALLGCEDVRLGGQACRLNAIAAYRDGVAMTVLRAVYKVDDSSVLDVRPDGTIVPKTTGETSVTVEYEGISAAAIIRVTG